MMSHIGTYVDKKTVRLNTGQMTNHTAYQNCSSKFNIFFLFKKKIKKKILKVQQLLSIIE